MVLRSRRRSAYPSAPWRSRSFAAQRVSRPLPSGGVGLRSSTATPALGCAVVVLATLGILLWQLTPWNPLPGVIPGGAYRPDPAIDFTAAQLARSARYHDQIRPWGLAELSLSIVVPALLGFTPLGARLADRLPGGRRPWLRVIAVVVALEVLLTVVGLPIAAWELVLEHRFGLSTQGFGSWFADVGEGLGLAVLSVGVAMLVVTGLARVSRLWWLWGAGLAAAAVLAVSFVYPVVVAPVFTSTHPLPDGPLRTSLVTLAHDDHQQLSSILVADASSRTTAENAEVIGFGGSKQLILDDTLLHDDTPAEIRVIAAHELGHAKTEDVLHGTIEAALAAAAALCLAGALLAGRRRWLVRAVGATDAGDPRIVPLLLAAFVVVSFLASPLVNLVSRRIEARADAHSLHLAQAPQAFVDAQRGLAVSGLTDLAPTPVLTILFFDHPPTAARIAMARDWAAMHHRPVPPGVTGTSPPRESTTTFPH